MLIIRNTKGEKMIDLAIMDNKKIVSTIVCIVFLVVSVNNFFRDLTPLLFILNIIGLTSFLVLTYINIKEILLNRSK